MDGYEVPRYRAKVQTTALRTATTWPEGMLVHDSDLNKLYVGDGATAGGLPSGSTRYFWVPPGYGTTAAYGGAVDVIAGSGGLGYISFRMPPTMTTLVSAAFIVRSGATTNATADIDLEAVYGDVATNETTDNTKETDDASTFSLTKDVLTAVSAMAVLTGVAGGDLVSIEFANNETTGSIFNYGFSVEWR